MYRDSTPHRSLSKKPVSFIQNDENEMNIESSVMNVEAIPMKIS